MSAVRPQGRVRAWPRGPLCSIALTLVAALALSGCAASSPKAADPAAQAATARLARDTSDNGLLFPPDLWTAVTPSVAATAWHAAISRALGRETPWPYATDETFRLLAEELDAPLAAWTLARALPELVSELQGICPDLADWQQRGANSGDVDLVWHTQFVGRVAGCQPDLDPATHTFLTEAGESNQVIVAWRARDTLAGATDTTPLPAGTELRDQSDIAPYLRLRARGGSDPARDGNLLRQAEHWAASDDEALLDLVEMALSRGDRAYAEQLAGAFAARVRPDGQVTEPPVFSGTLGSTYKMLDFYRAQGTLGHLSRDQREALRQAIETGTEDDPLYRLAAATAQEILQPGAVAPDRKQQLLAEVAALQHLDGTPLTSVDASLAWADLAGYAQAMDAHLDFPGLSPEALVSWAEQPLDSSATVLARLVIRASQAGAGADSGIQGLAARLASSPRTESASVIPTALAAHLTTGQWLHPPAELRALLARRQGGCLGGDSGFLRETDDLNSPCYLEISRYALDLSARLPQ